MVSYCRWCDQGLVNLFLPTDKDLDKLQPAYYCVNKRCGSYGQVTVIRGIDDIKSEL